MWSKNKKNANRKIGIKVVCHLEITIFIMVYFLGFYKRFCLFYSAPLILYSGCSFKKSSQNFRALYDCSLIIVASKVSL